MNRAEVFTTQQSAIQPGLILDGYVVGELVGSGGMGRVFTAVQQQTGRRFALKTLLSNVALNPEYFRLEIQVLRGLEHSGIVPLHAHGVYRGQPWFVMDLLEGATLCDALERQCSDLSQNEPRFTLVPGSGVRLRGSAEDAEVSAGVIDQHYASRDALLEVCHDVLEALAYLHSRGIGHGDIKPENIFLRPGQSAVLVDFGLASSFDAPRERLALSGRSLGSVSYMAPERLRGAQPDARADLYAFGCILYECLTGTHPFLRSTIDATKLAHLRATPQPPSALRPGISSRLDALVMRLLARSSSDRPGYAADVIELLARELPVRPGRRQHAVTPGDSLYLFRAPLVGRDAQLAAARSRLLDSAQGRGGSLLFCAADGMGKTRLVLDVMELALNQDARVFHVECSPPDDAQTKGWLEPLEALRRALREHGCANVEDLPSLLHSLRSLEQESSVLVVLDGIQHADEATRKFLLEMCRSNLPSSRTLLVATANDAPVDAELLAAFSERLELLPLSEAEVEVALRALLAVEFPSPSLVRAAYQVSEGSPAILVQYLRALLEAGALRRNRHQGWHLASPLHEPVPHGVMPGVDSGIASIQSLFRFRARELQGEELRLASIAALLDSAFDAELLAAVADVGVDETLRVLAVLRARSIVEDRKNGGYRISHALLGRALCEQLPADVSKRLHRRAAAVWWRARAERGVASSVLGRHLSACGARRRAARCFAEAARLAMLAHRRHDALDWFGAAIAELGQLPSARLRAGELLALFEQRGDVAMGLRNLAEAQASYNSALAAGPADDVERARLHRKLASALQRERPLAVVQLERAMQALEAAHREHPEYRFEWLQLRLDRMWVHYWEQETSQLLAIAERIAPDVESFGTAAQRASLHFNLAVGLMQKNRYVTAQEELRHVNLALSLYQELDAQPNVAMCRFLRSMLLLFSEQLAAADEGFRAVLAISEKATSATIRVRALTFLCISRRKQRDAEGVRKLASAAYSLATEHDMPEYQGTAMANLAWVAMQDGALEEAEQLIARARQAWQASPLNVFRWTALLPQLAMVLRRAEQADDAATLQELARSLLDTSQQRLPDALHQSLELLRDSHGAAPTEVRALASAVVEHAIASRHL